MFFPSKNALSYEILKFFGRNRNHALIWSMHSGFICGARHTDVMLRFNNCYLFFGGRTLPLAVISQPTRSILEKAFVTQIQKKIKKNYRLLKNQALI